jgi:L-asparaginase
VNSEFSVAGLTELPSVEILYSYVEPSQVMLRALVASGVKGIVFAGTGAGLISSFEKAALKEVLSLPLDSRPILVRSSRTGNGRVVAREEYDAMGMVPADNLNPQKARILLMLALTKTRNVSEIARIFATY